MVKVTFTSHNKEIYCNKGDKLLDVARNADIFIDAPCNGNVSCGKCKVRLIKGKVDTEKTHHIKDEEWNQGYILACNTKVIEDIDIEVPSKLSSSMYGMKIEGSDNRKDKEVFDRAKKIIKENNFKFETNIEKTYIELDEPTLDDNISDIDRIERHISNTKAITEFLNINDIVDNEIIEHFRNVLPPKTDTSYMLQCGDAYDHILDDKTNKYKGVYITFNKENGNWIYKGVCFIGDNINRSNL